jgi:hypothetical protein
MRDGRLPFPTGICICQVTVVTVGRFALAMHTEVTGNVEVPHIVLAVTCDTSEHERLIGRCSPASLGLNDMILGSSYLRF